jgi:hypothetical protein
MCKYTHGAIKSTWLSTQLENSCHCLPSRLEHTDLLQIIQGCRHVFLAKRPANEDRLMRDQPVATTRQPPTWASLLLCWLNYWVMHPVARVSIKYWKNLRTQQSRYRGNTKLTPQKIIHDALRRRQLLLTFIYRNILDFRVCYFDADLYID